MARIRVQGKTRRRESRTVHCFSLSLEARLANVVRRHVASRLAPVVPHACPAATRRRTTNSSFVRVQPFPERAAKIHPRGLVSLSLHETRRERLVDTNLRRRIPPCGRSRA